jgi:preprotein translocase subunit SecA
MIAPAKDYQRTQYRPPSKPLQGADAAFNRLIGHYHRRNQVSEKLRQDAEAINALAPGLVELSDGKLHQRLMELREQFHRGGSAVEEHLHPALAAIREASARQLGMRPFLVQIMGALALYRGYLAEMATGEGKTLTAGLAAVLAGWTKRPCHIVTVNDYLVERDAERLTPLYTFCGIRVGCVTGAMEDADRHKGHACDVTYTTSKELLADFLRDRIRLGDLQNPTRRLIRHLVSPLAVAKATGEGLVMRGLHTAIVDEADSVLIDEAVTPLIISAAHENEQLKEAVRIGHEMIADLHPGADYEVKARYKEIELTETGKQKLLDRAAILRKSGSDLSGLWQGTDRRLELLVQALAAREFFTRDKQYIVENGQVVIVDEFTGRPMPQRTWREGMHQAIEAKEGVLISNPSETMARLSFQRFFRCFYKLSGMTGTAREASAEFWQIYQLPVVQIPTNRPCVRKQWPDRVLIDEETKWAAIVEEIARIHAQGRPILVGTRSVYASELLAGLLARKQLQCNVLNASRLNEEASIIAMAGEHARITIATNMAGRGTDILLGRDVAALGGLHVIATERHESGRVDRQLFGRSARQGDPGSSQAFVSLQDELISRYLPATVQKVIRNSFKSGAPGSRPLADTGFWLAQRKAQRLAAKQRQAVLKSDLWLDEALSFAGGNGI